MSRPLRPLPIVECWDCHCTGTCCRGTIVGLNADDVARLRQQGWAEHPDYRGQRIIVGGGWFGGQPRLAKRPDGMCVFSTAEGLCRIHCELGEAAKPLVCRMFPLQIVPVGETVLVTLRRYCPSAALNKGRPVVEHLPYLQELVAQGKLLDKPVAPPALVPGHRRGWNEALRVAECLERLMLDARFPPVRRLAHGLAFCELLEQCRMRRIERGDFGSLVDMLERSAVGDERVAVWFRMRRPPGRAAGLLFRQVLLEYIRLHPQYVIVPSWAERWRLVRAAMGFMRGKGPLPQLHPCFYPTTFEALEQPLGPLEPAALEPLARYFEAAAASKQYVLLGRSGWSLTEGFASLSLSFAVAMWMIRLGRGAGPATIDHVVDVVAAIDRGQGFAALCGRRHRHRVNSLVRIGALPRLLAWYAQ